jgi:uncharacterized membrane protein YedE/YeeE
VTAPQNAGRAKRVAALVTAFAAGLVFAAGLGISGMGRPAKVLAFLDVTGAWDPSLAFVMAGAIGVHMGFALRARRGKTPLLTSAFVWPRRQSIDASLLLGSVVFGVGWGLAGYCPGPAVMAVASGNRATLAFFGAMCLGMLLVRAIMIMAPRGQGPSDDGSRLSEPRRHAQSVR